MTIAALFLDLLNLSTAFPVLPAIAMWFIYPFCKRFTDYPQVALSIVQGWGVVTGDVATRSDLNFLGVQNPADAYA